MSAGDLIRAIEIRDGLGNPQHTIISPSREAEPDHGPSENLFRVGIELAERSYLANGHLTAFKKPQWTEAATLPSSRSGHPPPDFRRRFHGRKFARDFFNVQRGYLDMEIDSVQQ